MRKPKSNKTVLLSLLLVSGLAVTACSGNNGGNTASPSASAPPASAEATASPTAAPAEDGLFNIADFSNVKTNQGEAIEGGTLNYGLVSDTAFEGTLNYNFSSGTPDSRVLAFFDEGLLDWDANYVYTNDGAATYEVSEDGKTFTFTIRDNVNWHDGEPVKAEDWLFSHEVIGSKEYTGVRYGSDFTNIVGMEAYHEGTADTISGIKVLSDKQLSIEFIEATPSLLTGSIWTYPLAKHIFKDIPIADMAASPQVRQTPVGFGAFKIDSIVPGESVVYVKNEDYWRGAPKLDGVVLRVINPQVLVQELKTGGVDLVDSFPIDQFPDNANLSNVEFLGAIDRAYSYTGFKLGTWDKENGVVKTDPDAKMANVALRKAMWQAVDNNTVGERFYHGLRWNATTLIPPSHPEFHDASNPGMPYDPEAAKQTLEDAGFKLDGEFRTTPDGSPLEINFIAMTGSEISEPLAQYYVQAWKSVGLNVSLEMVEFNTFYDRVGQNGDDDPTVDVYQGAWTVGIDVDPRGLYSRDALFNFSRYSSDRNDEIMARGVSQEAFDVETRKEIYKEWQQFMVEEIPVFPTLYRSRVVPVNNRVLNYAIGDGTNVYLNDLALSAETAEAAQ